jgi:hypothetical protein
MNGSNIWLDISGWTQTATYGVSATTAFNATSGIFTAPTNGYYMVNAMIRCDDFDTGYFRIATFVNGLTNVK